MKKIIFVVTNFNNSSFTESLLRSISNNSKNIHVYVVDNCSVNSEKEKLKLIVSSLGSWVTTIFNDKNLGYFEGLNVGIRRALHDNINFSHMVVGNNDLIFHEEFFMQLSQCVSVFRKYPIVSPDIRMLDGSPQNPHVVDKISKKREFIYDLYHSSYFLAKFIVKLAGFTSRFTDRKDEQQFAIEQEIYQGYGACYILTPKYFDLFRELPSDTFLMYEEFFLANQLKSKGYRVYYKPSIKVQHYCHASTGLIPGKLKWLYSRASHKEYRKYVKVWSKEY